MKKVTEEPVYNINVFVDIRLLAPVRSGRANAFLT